MNILKTLKLGCNSDIPQSHRASISAEMRHRVLRGWLMAVEPYYAPGTLLDTGMWTKMANPVRTRACVGIV